MSIKTYKEEVRTGKRFEFGKNWANYLESLSDDKINIAKKSVKDILKVDDLTDKKVLDIGCGSGLFSLSAKLLGANVHSFDFDPHSVGCTQELKEKYFPNTTEWQVEQGSVLDEDYVKSLGQFDVVYSWGVLHHTGQMMNALKNANYPVAKDGLLCIAIYNDQGFISKFWTAVKIMYCKNALGRFLMKSIFVPYFFLRALLSSTVEYGNPFKKFSEYRKNRGMNMYTDWIDWIGGYPFEVASVEKIKNFYEQLGFELINLVETKGLGCNQFTFKKTR